MNPRLFEIIDGWKKKIIKKRKQKWEEGKEHEIIYIYKSVQFDGNTRVRTGDDTLSRSLKRIGETQLRHRIIIVSTRSILYKFPLSHKKTFRARNVSRRNFYFSTLAARTHTPPRFHESNLARAKFESSSIDTLYFIARQVYNGILSSRAVS